MELKEFSKLIAKDANEAKNILSYLIGILKNDAENQKAIIEIYKSFSDEIKKEEKLFAPIICKFLTKYGINNETYPYYEQFNKYWTAIYKDTLKKKNTHWKWDKTSYKNSLDFIKASEIHKYHVDGNPLGKFIEESEEELNKILLKDKNKFIENGLKRGFFKSLIKSDYVFFKNFCEKYSVNYEDIIKEIITTSYSYYGVDDLIKKSNIPEALINDLFKDEFSQLLKEIQFFNPNSNKPNILDLLLVSLYVENYDIVSLLIKNHEDLIKQCLNVYICKKEYKDIDLQNKEAWDLYKKYSKTNQNGWNTTSIINASFKDSNDYSVIIRKIKLNIELNDLPINETKPKKIKI